MIAGFFCDFFLFSRLFVIVVAQKRSRCVAFAEHECFGSTVRRGIQLRCEEVNRHESEQESNQYAKVSPDMGIVILVRRGDESVATDCALTSHGACNTAYERVTL